MHESSDVAPTAAEYLPVTQSVHASGPATPLYVPARHLVQGPPLGPDEPALQVQAAKAKLPAVESELDGHSMHVVESAVQVPTNPARVTLPSDVKTTFRYGWLVEDVYVLELVSLPESFASSVSVLHDDDVH